MPEMHFKEFLREKLDGLEPVDVLDYSPYGLLKDFERWLEKKELLKQ